MRQINFIVALSIGFLFVSGCQLNNEETAKKEIQNVNAIADSELTDIMLTVADPNEAVSYFKRTINERPDDITARRGLATSLIRANRAAEAKSAWKNVLAHDEVNDNDRLGYADALIRNSEWAEAKKTLDTIPPTYESHKRYKLEAMVADSQEQWKRADSFYEIATELTTTPSSILNNWGFSKLTRKDYSGAEALFLDALKHDPSRFTIKHNLVLARAAQGKYTLPVIEMTQKERAELLHTLGLAAVKKGDINIAKTLFRDAIETHPQHFEAAVRNLETLENS